MSDAMTNEDIIADALGRAPDIQIGSKDGGWHLSRWRQFVGSYSLPALPDPVFTVHIAGKPQVKIWDKDGWSDASSMPGCSTIVPAGQQTGWLVDGELDVVTLSLSSDMLRAASADEQFRRMKFAFADPLGVALSRQVIAELYAPPADDRTEYIGALVNALKAHILRGTASAPVDDVPTSTFSAYRLHQIMGEIDRRPNAHHSLENMAETAGVSPSHFCRVFRQAIGIPPHKYIMRKRLDRAKEMLSHTGLSLAAIAESVGFASQSHFTRAFRQYAATTPSDFRKKMRDIG
ncbi:AraC family transcriptional regulator [Aquisediminimonas sediminicola]|uniref:AraC family transcriptional regulator n=1 Tax=Alteraquisediminimonas sediminicola TaxID=2676787 RepID=UPI001C8E8C66|nr:AraC family transcriptional regulator [Aquisediminimonas sediminicola]